MMEIDLIFKIAAIGIIVAVINQVLIRFGKDEQAMLTSIVVLLIIITQINRLFETIKNLFSLY